MEERITELEQKLNQLIGAVEAAGMRQIALKAAFARLCGPLLAATGTTPEQIRQARDGMSVGALWMSIPDADAHMLSEALADVFEEVAVNAETALGYRRTPS